ncbi:hypothetical protein AX15_005342 [Amanita polypyramis BW_CC]|nr:hypothetical protein AX15_005342 [Amanita polypyramis BW_CC]
MTGPPRHYVSVGNNANFSSTIGFTLGVRATGVDLSHNTSNCHAGSSLPVPSSEQLDNEDRDQASGAPGNTNTGQNSTDDLDNSPVENDNRSSGAYAYDNGNESDGMLSTDGSPHKGSG